MKTQAILLSSMLIAAGSTWAGESLFENTAKQTAVESVKSAAPSGVQQINAAGQTLENANSLTTAPAVAKEQAEQAVKESITQKIDTAIPSEAKETTTAIKTGKESVDKLKATPKTIKEGAKQKAAEKTLDLLH
jgi:hypothetical protein